MAYASMNTEYAPARIVIDTTAYSSEDIRIDNIQINTGCYDGGAVGVGATYTATCTITMQDVETVKIGSIVRIYFYLDDEWKEFGKFWVNSQPVLSGELMTLNCHGALGQQGDTVFWYPGMFYTNEETTIGNLLTGITEVSEMSTLEFDTDVDISSFLARKITIPIKEESFSPSTEINYANNHGISKREFLSGIAILFGGNVSERNGILYFVPKTPDASRERVIFTSDCYSDHTLSRESYGINAISIDYTPTRYIGYFDTDPSIINWKCQCYSGTDRKSRAMLVSQTDGLGADITYSQSIECDWIGYSAETEDLNCAMQSDLKYRTGEYLFIGYNENLYAGNIVDIEDEKGNTVSFYIGEMTVEWDGGFTTRISCNCDVDVSTGTYNSGTQNTSTSSQTTFSAMNSHNNSTFANNTLSNVVNADEGFIGVLTSNEIFTDTLTANEGFIDKLTSRELFTETLSANEGFIDSLTSSKIFTEKIEADVANISTLDANSAIIKNIFSQNIIGNKAVLDVLQTNVLDAETIKAATAEFGYITSDEADMKYVTSEQMETRMADIQFADIGTAEIDTASIGILFNAVGLTDHATFVEGKVTGFLDTVKLNANNIETGTLIADRILLRGSEKGLLYALNNSGDLVSTHVDTLDGAVLSERTISADKIVVGSITATELDIENIFADQAVIESIFADNIEGAHFTSVYAEIEEGTIASFNIYADRLESMDGKVVMSPSTGFYSGNQNDTTDDYIYIRDGELVASNGNQDTVRLGLVSNEEDSPIQLWFDKTQTDSSTSTHDQCFYKRTEIRRSNWQSSESGIVEGASAPFSIYASSLSLRNQNTESRYFYADTNGLKITNNIEYTMYGYTGIPLHVWGGASNNGLAITIGGGARTIVGAGESGRALESILSAGTEELALSSDNNIIFLTNCNNIANRAQVTLDTSRQFYPVTSSTTGAGSIGTPDDQWATGYIYELHSHAIYENGYSLRNTYAVTSNGTPAAVKGNGGWQSFTVPFGNTYEKPPVISILPYTQFASENIRFVSFTGSSANGYSGMTYEIYTPDSNFSYRVRWMAIGNLKI